MDNQDYVIDGNLAFGNTYNAMKFYQSEYHKQKDRIAELEKDNKELHKIAQVMAMKESDARKSLQNHVDAVNTSQECVDKTENNRQEPVAWAVWEGKVHDMFFTEQDAKELARLKGGDAKSIPLYTTPQTKPLSDEEINQLWYESQDDAKGVSLGFTTQQHYFARAIEERILGK